MVDDMPPSSIRLDAMTADIAPPSSIYHTSILSSPTSYVRSIMTSQRNMTTAYMDTTHAWQLVSFVLFSVFCVASFYIFIILFINECRSSQIVSKKGVKYLRWILLWASAISTIFFLITLARIAITRALFSSRAPDMRIRKICKIVNAVQKITYSTVINSIYFIFWLRQKLFYSNPSVSNLYTSRFRLVSWAVLTLIVVCYVTQTVLSLMGLKYVEEDHMCMKPQRWLQDTQMVLGAITSVCTHVALLPLFVYPLMQHRAQTTEILQPGGSPWSSQRKFDSARAPLKSSFSQKFRSSVRSTVSSVQHHRPSLKVLHRSERRLLDLIKRCCFITCSCIFVNLTATTVTAVFYRTKVVHIGAFVYGFNLLVNIVCAVGVLRRCRKILLPCCLRSNKRLLSERKFDISVMQSISSSQAVKLEYKSVEI